MVEIPDVDLDVVDREWAIASLDHPTNASQLQVRHGKNVLVPHNTGVYLQRILTDPVTGLASLPYEQAEQAGFFKLDLIRYSVYDRAKNRAELVELSERIAQGDFPWEEFLDPIHYGRDDGLTQLGKWLHVVQKYPPNSVEDVACLIAMIRPAKQHLWRNNASWEEVRAQIWLDEPDGYRYKKSHAIAFAYVVCCDLWWRTFKTV